MNKDMLNYDGKTTIVTGGGRGIGRNIALRFADRGALVHIFDVNVENGEDTVEAIQSNGGEAQLHEVDVTDQEQVDDAIEKIDEQRGSIDVLINNAGIPCVGDIEDTTEEDMDRLYEVNVKGVYNCSKAAVEHMKDQENGGAILNLASTASMVGIGDRFAYSMSKGAVLTMTYSVAKDYIDDGIRCNSVAPARIHTPFVDQFISENFPGQEEEKFDELSESQPIGRMGQPEEVADLILFLCSDEAGFITGQNYPIDGGTINLST